MNLFQIFNDIAKVDDKALDRFDTRRAVFGHLFSGAKKVTAAAAPVLLSTLFNKAYAGERGVRESVTDVLNYALTLERLELAFYTQGLVAGGLPLTGDDRTALAEIKANEQSHVDLLTGALGAAAGTDTSGSLRFDKVYTSVFTDRAVFLAVAQALEDTGVRAYKGRAVELQADRAVLEIALNIHSVEARHASHVRRMRGENAWITGKNTTIPTVSAPGPGGTMISVPGNAFYAAGTPATGAPSVAFPAEDNTTQSTLTGTSYAGNGIAADRYTEAFDEPINKQAVLDTVTLLFG